MYSYMEVSWESHHPPLKIGPPSSYKIGEEEKKEKKKKKISWKEKMK